MKNDLIELRNRPTDNYIFDASWQDLYILTKHWKSDLLFFKDDLRFLDDLIDKYVIWISKEDDLESVRDIEKSIIKTAKECDFLLQGINKHLTHIEGLIEDAFKYDSHKFRTEHQHLENDITIFVKTFRVNKKEVFEVTKHLIESDELIRILTKAH